MTRLLLSLATAIGLALPAAAQDAGEAVPAIALDAPVTAPPALTPEQAEQCVALMSGFPDESTGERYLFFRLSQELAKGVTPELTQTMARYLADNETRRLPSDTPMMDVVEDIADPVLRQAAPERTVAGLAHIAYFDTLCGTFVAGQVDSLAAFDPALREADIYIREDALYLRQLLAEALDRLGGGVAVEAYTASLVVERDDIEFTGFESDVGELEALYMGDLDTKLARSNDAVNEAVSGEAFQDALALAEDMNQQARKRAQRERLATLCQISPYCTVGY